MDIKVLQNRIRSGDQRTYLDLSDEYGWTLYSFLSKRLHDPDQRQKVYAQILSGFYRDVPSMSQQGSVDTLLLQYADIYCRKISITSEEMKTSGGFGFWVALILLLLLNGICLWIIGGILMEMGILPETDLGYHWLKELILI